jgi:hypothetical protein
MDDILQTSILSQYLRQAALAIPGVIVTQDSYNFQCNICGDDREWNPTFKRGHLRLYRGYGTQYWTYKCFNEGCSCQDKAWPGEAWLEKTAPHLYDEYQAELLSDSRKDHSEEIARLEKQVAIERRRVKKEKEDKEQKALEYFIEITDNHKLCKSAIDICKKRFIPEEIWSKFFVALPGKGSIYSNRMIIPFYDNEDDVYYWQGRALLDGQNPKYLNRLSSKDESVYNIYNVDKTKPIFITEGPIDSMFIENSVATLGLEVSDKMKEIINSFDNAIYLFDGDESGIRTSQKYINQGKKVFLWENFIKELKLPKREKWDINDFMVYSGLKDTKLSYEDLEPFISKSYYDTFWL